MTPSSALEGVEFLIPPRLHRARKAAAAAILADLSALIQALPTQSPCPALGALTAVDADQVKAWISAVVRALPTAANMEEDNGIC
jgi:hypothetical protein